jgi:hypothetical protein
VTKQEAIEPIGSLPDDVTRDDILYEIFVWIESEAGLADIRAGRTVPNEVVLEKIREWRRRMLWEPGADA